MQNERQRAIEMLAEYLRWSDTSASDENEAVERKARFLVDMWSMSCVDIGQVREAYQETYNRWQATSTSQT
jgi:hypothetical protein